MTEKERNRAVQALRCAADLDIIRSSNSWPLMFQIAGLSKKEAEDSGHVVARAWDAVYDVDDQRIGRELSWLSLTLEAAALLEDGWNPGEPVERIGGDS